MNTSTIPVYQSEIAPPKIRGFLVLFEGALITLGIMISYWLNYGQFLARISVLSASTDSIIRILVRNTAWLISMALPDRFPNLLRGPPYHRHTSVP